MSATREAVKDKLRYLPLLVVFAWMGWRAIPRSVPQPDVLDVVPEVIAEQGERPDVGVLLARLAEVYRTASSHRDELWARSIRIDDGERELWSVEHAELALLRPERLRWQWREHRPSKNSRENHAFLSSDDTQVLAETEHWKRQPYESLGEGLARVCSGYENDLLQLLFPGRIAGRPLLERMQAPRVTGLERFRGRECHRVEGSWPHDDGPPTLYALWIDRETSHLVRLVELRSITDWQLERTAVYAPEGEAALTEADFRLDEEF